MRREISLDEEEGQNPNSGWRAIVLRSQLFLNMKSPAEVCLADLTKGYLNPNVSEQGIKRLLTKDELAGYYREQVLVAEFCYNPHAAGALTYNAAGGEIFNSYQPPAWRHENYFTKAPLPAFPTAPPALLDRYFDHLVDNDSASKEYLLDWLATALRSRNFTILTAIGEPGIGKGKLGEIMSGLVGESNFARVRDTVFKKQFNAPLRNKQLVYVDEVAIVSNEEIDRVKDVVNSRIEIEQKGVDPEEVENHASFYLTSNRMDAIRIESSDRRFSIIQLTDVSLLKTFSVAEVVSLTSKENVDTLALYLMGRTIVNDMYKPFRSARYDEVLEAGLTEWELHLTESFFPGFVMGAELPLEALKAEITKQFGELKRPPGRHRLEAFVRKYSENLKIDRSRAGRIITIIKRFQSKS